MRFCERCGNRQQEEWVTCPYCGTANVEPVQPHEPFVPHTQVVMMTQEEIRAEAEVQTVESVVAPQPSTPAKSDKKRFPWWKWLILAELVAAVGLSVYAVILGISHWGSSSSSQSAPGTPTVTTTTTAASDENYGFDFDFDDDFDIDSDIDSDLDFDFDGDDTVVLDVSLSQLGWLEETSYVHPSLDLRFETLDVFPVDYELMEELTDQGIDVLYAGVQESRGNALVLFAEETTMTAEEYAEQYVNATAEQFGDASIVVSDPTVKTLGGRDFITYTMYIDGRVDFVGVTTYAGYAVVLDIYITNETQLQSVLKDIHTYWTSSDLSGFVDSDFETFA